MGHPRVSLEDKTDFRSTINFDKVAWQQAYAMADADGLCLSAMLRVLIRDQYKQRKLMGDELK